MVLAHVALPSSGSLDVFHRARALVPTAKRVLLLEWGLHPHQMTTVSQAVARGLIDSVLTRPSAGRDEEFHSSITEDLGDWAWTTAPTVEAVRVVVDDATRRAGHRSNACSNG